MHVVYADIFIQNSIYLMHNVQAILPIKIGVFDSLFIELMGNLILRQIQT